MLGFINSISINGAISISTLKVVIKFAQFIKKKIENRINNALVTQLIIQNTTNNIRQQQQERTTNAVNNLLNGNFRVRRVAQALPDVFTARVTIPAIFRRVLAEIIGKFLIFFFYILFCLSDSCFIMLAKIIFLLIVYSDSIATIFSPSAEVVENIIGDLTSTFLLQTTFIDEVYYDDIAQMDFSVGEDLLSVSNSLRGESPSAFRQKFNFLVVAYVAQLQNDGDLLRDLLYLSVGSYSRYDNSCFV